MHELLFNTPLLRFNRPSVLIHANTKAIAICLYSTIGLLPLFRLPRKRFSGCVRVNARTISILTVWPVERVIVVP